MFTNLEKSVDQFMEIVIELRQRFTEISDDQIYNVAAKIQENLIREEFNEMYGKAHVVNTITPCPSALEKIAMELEKFNNNN
jgi:hypothetical protein